MTDKIEEQQEWVGKCTTVWTTVWMGSAHIYIWEPLPAIWRTSALLLHWTNIMRAVPEFWQSFLVVVWRTWLDTFHFSLCTICLSLTSNISAVLWQCIDVTLYKRVFQKDFFEFANFIGPELRIHVWSHHKKIQKNLPPIYSSPFQ